ncbi:MAG: MTH1187 family thiamine-binding protein [Candidatus Methanoperedens sp.]|nr:MTH1187 family thiamine-binding protein [Candidatus Methanoperedens sp.]MCZ7361028.1 MTH1187 family thiamine-binding protein [Candidatus Methanoperedens sp.]HLB71186.1 MTH1187 family thiamine-binding protein [Candidatus Methanoperedens sp.]
MKPIITAQLEIVPLGTGSTSMSAHISEVVKAIEKSGVKYQLTPMGTVMEVSSIDEAFNAAKAAHEALVNKGIKRIVTHLTIDDRRDYPKGMMEKVESVKRKL